jgi:hypothetical protein
MNNYKKRFFFLFKLILKKYNKKQQKKVNEFLKKIKIIDSGYELTRIGAATDGGYLIPNILDQIQFCFSPGVGNVSSFEDNLLKFNIPSFLADGTVSYTGKHNFLKKNLNSFDDEKNITLQSWVNSKIKDKLNNNLLLQMDIEGSEIEVLYQTDTAFLDRFKSIIIEFHNFHDIITPLGLKIYSDIFEKILKTHYIVHIHPNNHSRVLNINKNLITNLIEVTFINKKIAKCTKPICYTIPHKLDQKCAPCLPEIICPEIFYK